MILSVGGEGALLELSYAGGEECNTSWLRWKTIWQLLTELNIRLPYDSAIPLLPKSIWEKWAHMYTRNLPERNEYLCIQENLYKNYHNSFIHKGSKLETAQISISGWMDNKLRPIHTKTWTTDTVTIWMNLRNIMLSESNQTLYPVWFLLHEGQEQAKLILGDKG